jgi:hypothetical protein
MPHSRSTVRICCSGLVGLQPARRRDHHGQVFAAFLLVQRPHRAIDHGGVAADGKADAVFVDLAVDVLGEAADAGMQLGGGDIQRLRQEVVGRADRRRADSLSASRQPKK